MGESRRKKERRRDAPKPTEKLPPLPLAADKAVAAKQRAFCKAVIGKVLDDDSSLSFSKPVRELWDMSQLSDYFERIKNPMDLGTVRKNLNSGGYVNAGTSLFDPNAFRYEVRLVFLNAMDYNGKGTDLYRLGVKFLQFIDSELSDLPGQPAQEADQEDQLMEDVREKSEKPEKSDKAESPEKTDKTEKDDTEKKEEEGTDEKSDQLNEAEPADEEMKDDEPEENGKEPTPEDEEAEKLKSQVASLIKHRARAEAALAELELVRNVPLTHEENAKLRDDVEALPWDTAKKVVKILRKYVDEALAESKEEDPEFVTLEFSTVEPRLLRDIEALIRPDPRVEKERKAIENLNEEIGAAQRKLRKLPPRDHGIKKKPRRRR